MRITDISTVKTSVDKKQISKILIHSARFSILITGKIIHLQYFNFSNFTRRMTPCIGYPEPSFAPGLNYRQVRIHVCSPLCTPLRKCDAGLSFSGNTIFYLLTVADCLHHSKRESLINWNTSPRLSGVITSEGTGCFSLTFSLFCCKCMHVIAKSENNFFFYIL